MIYLFLIYLFPFYHILERMDRKCHIFAQKLQKNYIILKPSCTIGKNACKNSWSGAQLLRASLFITAPLRKFWFL
ncbi:hypothetical protein DRA42_07100 [Ethanoligenens harbinense]|nr:hypothetical protein CXQ68_07070 [Ethanoligenens harbinense YUAN-3]AYF38666.1 hypothetical protein CXP51_06940 [Ethanoligenens harbinense]AYF41413.1 hypothetical protein CN246_07080 [Ethanoligenens harbinense]QCN92247.1 hypothetical protein DRA42_07100 [Ethanoligenens harbinense]